jgi:serine/threonine-protein kinase
MLALGAAFAGGLATWLVTAALPSAHQSPPAPPASSSPSVQTVDVNSADLVGQQVSDVSQMLSNLGLTPVVTYTSSSQDGQNPGSVVSVMPSGPVPVGSTVTVTATFQGGHHDHGNRNGGDGGN